MSAAKLTAGLPKLTAGMTVALVLLTSAALRGDDAEIARFEKRLRISMLSDQMICGGAPTRADLAFLARSRGITRVISLLDPSPEVDKEAADAKDLGIAFESKPLAIGLDGPMENARVDRAVARSIIDEIRATTEGTVYVHCQSGRDRAGFIRFAHRVILDGWGFADALKEALDGGFSAAKLPGFYKDMKLLVSELDELPKIDPMPITDQDLHSKVMTAAIGAQTLNVKMMGEGSPLYAIHGGPGESHKLFRPYLDELSKTHKLVYYDQVGCGGSTKPQFAEAYTLERQVNELEALRVVAKHEKISLIAQSSGCLLAIKYALLFPDRVDKMILVSGWASAEEFKAYIPLLEAVMPETDHKKYEFLLDRLRKALRRPNDRELAILVGFQVPGIFFGEVTDAFGNDWLRHLEISAYVNAVMEKEVFHEIDMRPQLATITGVPTLVISGKFDLITPPSVVETIAKGIPGAKFQVFEQSGHYPYVEENRKFIDAVVGFLSESNAPAE
jgi:proline iminopeptidase